MSFRAIFIHLNNLIDGTNGKAVVVGGPLAGLVGSAHQNAFLI
jgi:hypothetical protein